ncbi:MAG: hypothetical protein J0M33_17200 [Anaerolineae bacterium]|nr:hypothetical protein [Anaerolineae bacterium]
MPVLARYTIKTALVHLALALVIGLALAAQSVFQLPAFIATLRPVFLHLLIVGWLTQLIFGVATWMFPKYSKEQPRGNPQLGWTVYLLLNLGLILRAIGEPLIVLQPGSIGGPSLVISALLQVTAGWLFIITIWPRVKER